MITGDNPLTALHVARDVEIVDREALILDVKENPAHETGKLTLLALSKAHFWQTLNGAPLMKLR
jgi:magnesium-transporting ATPase (P-type)